ncbi:hypothetical protein DO97_14515 [Neosynechococcus sphagnicola sy1]|uniref:Uncharacterized protein n=1 Tax=Neosynechococcus sphagnicola sy1 TaxID=1497020 RepID=A0A098TIH1_9CYAN|nr:hypothetical protein DO97_14515 [Neosynechococcus sphagnicola sy1]
MTTSKNQELLARLILRGDQLLVDLKYPQAATAYIEALRIDPSSAVVYYKLGELSLKQNRWEEAIQYFNQAIELQPDLYWAKFGVGQVLAEQGHLDQAIETFRRVVELQPNFLFAHYHLALCLSNLGLIDEAYQAFQKTIEIDPRFYWAYFSLGSMLERFGHNEEAIATYQKGLEQEPKNSLAHHQLGDLWLKLGRWNDAVTSYLQAINLDSKYVWSHHNLGVALGHLDRWNEALLCHQKVAELKPDFWQIPSTKLDFMVQYQLGLVLMIQQKLDESVLYLKQAISIKPDFSTTYQYLSLALIKLKRWKEALQYRQKIEELEPDTDVLSYDSYQSVGIEFQRLVLWEKSDIALLNEYAVISGEFDSNFYYSQYPDIAAGGIDPVMHYITAGWKELRDPSPVFSTQNYLRYNPDVSNKNLNPFYHFIVYGRSEGRRSQSFSNYIFQKKYIPKVSILIPNYNHARYLPERLDSILNQTYKNYEIIILDDCSKDNSRDVIEKYHSLYPSKIQYLFNKINSGSVFKQWEKGLSLATCELVWICESDDSCDPDFLEKLVKFFADPSIMVAFGRIQFMDEDSVEFSGLDDYRESAFPGIWKDVNIATSNHWFNGAFGIRNVIANVGGCVFRNQILPPEIWSAAAEYKVCADWFLYAVLAGGGRIAYEPTAKSYFRQHSANTSVTSFASEKYFREHFRVAKFLRNYHGISENSLFRFYALLADHYKHSFKKSTSEGLIDLFDISSLLKEKKITKHILIASLGFHLGGGEIFPIHLANQLLSMGYLVSFAILDSQQENEDIRNMLNRRIPVYCKDLIDEIGIESFIREANINLIHSHNPGWEYFFSASKSINIPYIVTHHGAYECEQIDAQYLLKFLKLVDHWVYISEKNLAAFDQLPLSPLLFTKLPNAVPVREGAFPLMRSDLGISDDAFVFGIASRAIRSKGWEEAIKAALIINDVSDKELFILLCGDGEEKTRLSEIYDKFNNVKFLGYQKKFMVFIDFVIAVYSRQGFRVSHFL